MSGASFDPFDLPATFDPLAPVTAAPPRRRRLALATAVSEAPDSGAGTGAGGRLAHLLRPRAGATDGPAIATAADTRIEALETRLATLTARVAGLESIIASGLDDPTRSMLQAVAGPADNRGVQCSRVGRTKR